MDENTEIDISEYHQTPLASLMLPDNYLKLIQGITRLSGLNNSSGEKVIAETVGDIFELEPYQFSKCPGFGGTYVGSLIETLMELKKEFKNAIQNNTASLPISGLVVLKKNISTKRLETERLQPQLPPSTAHLETPLNQLALSPKYQKLIKRISAVMDNIETVQDIIDIDVTEFSKLPAVGKLYVELLICLQNALSPTNSSQSNSNIIKEIELPPQTTLSKL